MKKTSEIVDSVIALIDPYVMGEINETIYVPTEANLPILEANRRK